MSNWLLALVGVIYFCASMSAFYEFKPVLGCVLLAWAVGNFGWLMIGMGMR